MRLLLQMSEFNILKNVIRMIMKDIMNIKKTS